MKIVNENPYIGQSFTLKLLEVGLFMIILFLMLLTKVYEKPFFAYVISLIYSIYFYYRYVHLKNSLIENSMHWARVNSKIINKKLVWKQEFFDRTAGYVPDILYQYTFNDETYRSRQFSLADRYMTERDQNKAQKFLNEEFQDKSIDIYVNPQNPKQSYIYKDINSKGRFSFLGYLLVIPLPLFLLSYILNL